MLSTTADGVLEKPISSRTASPDAKPAGLAPHYLGFSGECRSCQQPLQRIFADLGTSPLCQQARRPEELNTAEAFYPLVAFVCERCLLVQVPQMVTPETLFTDYQYFSSYSDSWLAHARRYVDDIVPKLGLNARSRVVELASNDGYLLQNFVARGIPCQGIEPAANVAAVAQQKGIPTKVCFFGAETARQIAAEDGQADLILGNNVLAHTPYLLSFVEGLSLLLRPTGTVTLEFPHLLRLMLENQFDTIYHEHFSYFSLLALQPVFARFGLRVYHVEHLPTHGGSLRLYVCHAGDPHPTTEAVTGCLQQERNAGLTELATYDQFAEQVKETKRKLLEFLMAAKRAGKRVVGYGAPGKGNTLLNYCGIRTDFLDYTVDRSPHKQGRLLPGTMIPIRAPEVILADQPDYVLILPWNLQDEIASQMAAIRGWGGKFVIPIPEVRVLD